MVNSRNISDKNHQSLVVFRFALKSVVVFDAISVPIIMDAAVTVAVIAVIQHNIGLLEYFDDHSHKDELVQTFKPL